MAEIEIKVLGIDPDRVIERLTSLGAKPLFDGMVKCIHFDRDHALRKEGKLFRLRRWEADPGFVSKFEICFKGPKQVIENCKVREEIETTVESADQFEQIMEGLGYEITLNNEKRRLSYQLGQAHIDIDAYPTVPMYLEIEGPDSATIDEALRQLELLDFERSTESAEELFARLWPEVDFENLKWPR